MKRRYIALFIIILMCIIVAVGGTLIFVRSDSVFKRTKIQIQGIIFLLI
ncbi:hypothetical protein [Caloramator sp. mosi_1]